jgi:flagellar biosynthesis GTPase FlhF
MLIVWAAKENDFDVVLIDTAGRMQDNEASVSVLQCPVPYLVNVRQISQPLMRALAKVRAIHAY